MSHKSNVYVANILNIIKNSLLLFNVLVKYLFLIIICFTACLFLKVLKNITSVSSVSYKTILGVCTRQDPPLRVGPSTIRYSGLRL